MKLPEGTIFSSGERYDFFNLLVKGESWEVDFTESDLIDIDSFSSEERYDRLVEMDEKGCSYPMNRSYRRDGLFDDEMIYLVYEKEDLEYLIKVLSEGLK